MQNGVGLSSAAQAVTVAAGDSGNDPWLSTGWRSVWGPRGGGFGSGWQYFIGRSTGPRTWTGFRLGWESVYSNGWLDSSARRRGNGSAADRRTNFESFGVRSPGSLSAPPPPPPSPSVQPRQMFGALSVEMKAFTGQASLDVWRLTVQELFALEYSRLPVSLDALPANRKRYPTLTGAELGSFLDLFRQCFVATPGTYAD